MQVNVRSQSTSSIIDTRTNRSKARRKLCWKLKFHHQALPKEHLENYEPPLLPSEHEMSPQSCTSTTAPLPNHRIPCVTVKYKDLPYMGEMTLDNAKPRRGRKPKKADICNLIYKNYNTTVVEEPLNLCLRDASQEPIPGGDDVSICKLEGEFGAISQGNQLTRKGSPKTTRKLLDKSRHGRVTKHKNKKSLAREKLERTFKERGFLIQTEQLESTQGATYCKFRQLRKFTRYLFRSWKHHLPGDVVRSH